jgi:hypothetical protein
VFAPGHHILRFCMCRHVHSLAVADAKALAKPVLASDLAAHRELEHPNARFLPPHEPEAWAAAMTSVLADLRPGPEERAERAAAEAARRASEDGARAAVRLFREMLS